MEDDLTPPSARYDWRDPTALTRDALSREIAALREFLLAMQKGMDDKFSTRFEAMDKGISLIQAHADKVPSEVDMKVGYLQALHDEKFVAMEKQLNMRFEELDKRLTNDKISSSTAVNAALQAAKEGVQQNNLAFAEAVSKSEKGTEKQMDQLGQMIRSTTNSLNEKIDASTARGETAVASLRAELLPQITGERTRGDRGEGRHLGQGAMIALMFSGVAAIGTIIGIVVILLRVAS